MEYETLQKLGPCFTETLLVIGTTYFLISSIASYIVEYVGACLNMRGKGLQFLLVELLEGPLSNKGGWLRSSKERAFNEKPSKVFGWIVQGVKTGETSSFAQSFLKHDLIISLEQPRLSLRGKNIFPSYLPSHTFATALFDTILNRRSQMPPAPYKLDLNALVAGASTAPVGSSEIQEWVEELKSKLQGALALPGGAPNGCKTGYDTLFLALTNVLSDSSEHAKISRLLDLNQQSPTPIAWLPTSSTPPAEAANMIGRVLLGGPEGPLAKLPASIVERLPLSVSNLRSTLYDANVPRALRNSLLPLIDAAQFDLDDLTKRVQTWFDDSMNRATGWYKRQVQLFLFLIGGLLVLLFNVDAITLVKQLDGNPALRAQLASQATGVVQSSANFPQAAALVRAADLICGADPTVAGAMSACTAKPAQATTLLPILLKDSAYLPIASAGQGRTDYDGLFDAIHEACDSAAEGALKDICPTVTKVGGKVDDGKARTALLDHFYSDPETAGAILDGRDPALIDAEIKRTRNIAQKQSAAATSFLLSLPDVRFVALDWTQPRLFLQQIFENLRTGTWVGVVQAGHILLIILQKFAGLALSAALVSLGAPFWFELLQNLVNTRATGPKPKTADDTHEA